ncbi:MAG: hypothetical protein PHW64_08375 [Sulfuricurvum sp.]|nr:hypothetical protein [Sulfuricurvum sp.]
MAKMLGTFWLFFTLSLMASDAVAGKTDGGKKVQGWGKEEGMAQADILKKAGKKTRVQGFEFREEKKHDYPRGTIATH